MKQLLEQDVAEDEIEKQTGVSDRTIRRWKVCCNMCLEGIITWEALIARSSSSTDMGA